MTSGRRRWRRPRSLPPRPRPHRRSRGLPAARGTPGGPAARRLVVDDQDSDRFSHAGAARRTVVPAPGAERISSVAPIRRARSSIDVSPSLRDRAPARSGRSRRRRPRPRAASRPSAAGPAAPSHAVGARVPQRVLERLLRDAKDLPVAGGVGGQLAVDDELDSWGSSRRSSSTCLRSAPPRPSCSRSGGRSSKTSERSSSSASCASCLQLPHPGSRGGRVTFEQRPGCFGVENEAEELLADGVVEVEREPVPLGDDRKLPRPLVETGVGDRDRGVSGEQADQLLVGSRRSRRRRSSRSGRRRRSRLQA